MKKKVCVNCRLIHEGEADCSVQMARSSDRAEARVNFAFRGMMAFLVLVALAGIWIDQLNKLSK